MQPTRKPLSPDECDALIAQHAPLVKSIALSLLRKLPASVELDDLMQDGYLGLLGVLLQSTRSEAEPHVQSYLAQRVRGAMLDGLRGADPGVRRVRAQMRRVEQALSTLSHSLGRRPHEGEVAAALTMSLAQYQQLLQEAQGYTLLSLEDFVGEDESRNFLEWCASTSSDPLAALQRRALQRALLQAISELGEREYALMQAYYGEGLTMHAIAARMSLSEGRISQIHAHAIASLRAALLAHEAPSLLAPRWRSA